MNLSFLLFFMMSVTALSAQEIISLYGDKIPNSRPAANLEKTEYRDGISIISGISVPTMTKFLPPLGKASGTAVIICPGGGYWVNAFSHEGTDVAKEFTKMGVAAFVLKYRIPSSETMVNRDIGPLQDAQQAIKIIRKNSARWGINARRVGIMGFSAGGHLASTAGTHFAFSTLENSDTVSVRPDFMMLIYPVISFQDSIGHIGSRDQLIGRTPSKEMIDYYSNELQVTSATPPTFLVHASDDDGVKPANSIAFYNQLLKHKVRAEIHIYQGGGHGFGLNNKTTSDLWMERAKAWLTSNGWLKRL